MDAASIVKSLRLAPLPGEGGYYRETYRSTIEVRAPLMPGEPEVVRQLGTAIYYLVTPDEFSALHRVKSDEVFHFYSGQAVEMLQIDSNGQTKTCILGPDLDRGHECQVLVPAGTWQGTRLVEGGRYALLGTTVFPAFEFVDMEVGRRQDLVSRYPSLRDAIERFTRG